MFLRSPVTPFAKAMIAALPPSALTVIAESLGDQPANEVVPVLVDLLTHTAPLVREGAVYGLAKHLANRDARDALEFIATFDTSPGVREAAEEALAS